MVVAVFFFFPFSTVVKPLFMQGLLKEANNLQILAFNFCYRLSTNKLMSAAHHSGAPSRASSSSSLLDSQSQLWCGWWRSKNVPTFDFEVVERSFLQCKL